MEIAAYPSGSLGANCYIVSDEETKKGFIVDPGGYNKGLVKYVQEKGIDILYIILTHGHEDHIGGVLQHKTEDFPDAKVVACTKEFDMLRDPAKNMSIRSFSENISITPDIGVNDGDEMKVGNINLRFIETPGHTPGGMCILADNVLFSGDTLFHGSVGRTDFIGGSYADLVSSIKDKLFMLPDNTPVLPGHMDQTTIGFEKKYNPFVR